MTTTEQALCGYRLPAPLEPGTAEWFAVMSASKMPQLMGLCPPEWGDRYTLWHEMRSQRSLVKENSAMGRGHTFEPLIRDWFARDHPHFDVRETWTWAHHERAWQTADPDAELWTDTGRLELLEIKTSDDLRDWGEPGTDEIPLYYRVQVMWQMATIGATRVHVAVCGPFELFNRKPRYYVVDYDPQDAKVLLGEAERHMQSLALGIEPARINATDKAMLAVRNKTPWIEDTGLEIPDEVAAPFLATLGECPTCREAKRAATDLLEFMGSAKKATYRGVTIANRVNGRNGAPPYLRAAKHAATALDQTA